MLPFILFIAFSLEFHFLKNNMQWQHTLMISQSLGSGLQVWSNGGHLAQNLSGDCNQGVPSASLTGCSQSVSGGCSRSQDSAGTGSTPSSLTWLLAGFGSLLAVGLRASGPCQVALYIRRQEQSERECKQNRSHTISHPHYESDIPSLLPQSIHYKQFVRANTHPRGGNQIREKIPGGEAQLGAILEAACHSWVQHFQLTVLFSQHSVDGIPVFSSFLCPRRKVQSQFVFLCWCISQSLTRKQKLL